MGVAAGSRQQATAAARARLEVAAAASEVLIMASRPNTRNPKPLKVRKSNIKRCGYACRYER